MPATHVSTAGIPLNLDRFGPALENQLRTELNCPRVAHSSYLAVIPGGHVGRQRPEVGVVENIKPFASQLQTDILAELNVLGQREIEPLRRWSINDASARISCHVDDS